MIVSNAISKESVVMEKEYEISTRYDSTLLQTKNNLKYDYNLFYEKKRLTPFQETMQVVTFFFLGLSIVLGLAYDTYRMYEENQDKIITPVGVKDGIIKMLPLNVEINSLKKV